MKLGKKLAQIPASSIFIMDGDPSVLDALGQLFKRVGFNVTTFEKLSSMLEILGKETPQCIVAEARLANKGNGRLVAYARHKTPIIMLASRRDISAAVRALKSGATDCLEKPVIDRLLIDSVERAIANFSAKI